MNQESSPPGAKAPAKPKPEDARKARLAAALRDNLKRRKQQDRARKSAELAANAMPAAGPPKGDREA